MKSMMGRGRIRDTGRSGSEFVRVAFSFDAEGGPVAAGSFAYRAGITGVVGFDDLVEFTISVGATTYTLEDLARLPDYRWFAYDTAAGGFLDGEDLTGSAGRGFGAMIAAVGPDLGSGFFVSPGWVGRIFDYGSSCGAGFTGVTVAPAAPVREERTSPQDARRPGALLDLLRQRLAAVARERAGAVLGGLSASGIGAFPRLAFSPAAPHGRAGSRTAG